MKYTFQINGSIGGWGYTAWQARRDLAQATGEVAVRICSLGGSLADALDIRQLWQENGAVTAYIVGMTASAATVLAMGAKRIVMDRHAVILVHNASHWFEVWGQMNKEALDIEKQKLEKRSVMLATLDKLMAEIYAERSGKTVEELQELMTQERWLTAQEALELGLVDEVQTLERFDETKVLDAAAFGLPPFAQNDTNSNNYNTMKETPHFLAAIGAEKLEAAEDGSITLTLEQLQAVEAALQATPSQQPEETPTAQTEQEPTPPTAPQEQQPTAESQQIAELKALVQELSQQINALKEGDGDETLEAPPAPSGTQAKTKADEIKADFEMLKGIM